MKKLIFLFSISLLWVELVHSNSLQLICFPSEVNLNAAKAHSLAILAPQDKVFIRESNHCLEFEISPSRVELLTKWIQKRFTISNHHKVGSSPIVTANTNSGQSNNFETCSLSVIEEQQTNEKIKEFSMGANSNVSETITNSTGGRKSSLLLGVGSQGTITVNETRVELTCLNAGTRYSIRVSLEGQRNAISTEVQVIKGTRVNLGSVVDDLNTRIREVNLNKGLRLQKKEGKTKKSYFLKAN